MANIIYQFMTDQRTGACAECFKVILRGLSFIYALIVRMINYAYDKSWLPKSSLNKPVISIGNITLGGVGKTPLSALLAQYIQQLNFKPVILSRGYKYQLQDGQRVNDEVLLLKEICPDVPVVVGANRFQSAQAYLKENEADVFILDDGFQHRKLRRDLDIVVLNATNPFGNEFLLPRGILREPISSLKRADFIILTKVDKADLNVSRIKDILNALDQKENIIECNHVLSGLRDIVSGHQVGCESLNGQRACLVSAIGDPESFEDLVKSIGIQVAKHFIYRDHYWYKEKDTSEILLFCERDNIRYILTTQKDSMKLKRQSICQHPQIHVLSLDIIIDFRNGKEKIYDRINSLLQR